MMMKRTMLLLAAAALPLSAGEILLSGGKLVPVGSSVVETFADDMNFCFATNYSNGEIHLSHSKGVHTVTEYQCQDVSRDNGKTWENVLLGTPVFAYSSIELPGGVKLAVHCWDRNLRQEHELSIKRLKPNGECENRKQKIELPYAGSFHMHRDIIRLRGNGKLIACAYGKKKDAKKNHFFLIESTDNGESWHFLATVAEDPEGRTPEGPGEGAVCELADGTLFAAWRDGGPLKYARSRDEGRTWGEYGVCNKLSKAVSPHMRLLKNGTLVLVTGRPHFHMLADFTGRGDAFQLVDLYRGGGSSYGSVLEIEPNRVLVIHDESTFIGHKSPTPFSRIIADCYDVVKDDKINADSADPRSKGFDVFYSAYDGKNPLESKVAVFFEYKDKKQNPDAPATFEVLQTPERPMPILRIVSRGSDSIKPNSQWATFRSFPLPSDHLSKIRIGFEVRILDNDVDTPQFMVRGSLSDPEKEGSTLAGQVLISADKIQLNGKTVLEENFLGVFRAFELEVDTGKQRAFLYRPGEEKPFAEAPLRQGHNAPGVWWGDGSTNIFGSADLSYIGWKTNN